MKQFENSLISPQVAAGNTTLYTNTQKNMNGVTTRYFSGIDAELYFGEKYIDDIVSWQIQLQQNVMPIFGYNSYVYDDVALGSRIIQGQFVVNFTKAGYLIEVLKTLQAVVKSRGMNIPFDQYSTNNKVSTKTVEPYSGSRKAIWDTNFEMVVSYGGGINESNPQQQMYIIGGVQITGMSQQFDASGQPIMEVYSFIARDMIAEEVKKKSSSSTTSTNKSAMQEVKPLDIKAVKYVRSFKKGSSQPVSGVINYDCSISPGIKIIDIAIKPRVSSRTFAAIKTAVNNNVVKPYALPKDIVLALEWIFKTTKTTNFMLDITIRYTQGVDKKILSKTYSITAHSQSNNV